jgi:hypothetical protein
MEGYACAHARPHCAGFAWAYVPSARDLPARTVAGIFSAAGCWLQGSMPELCQNSATVHFCYLLYVPLLVAL